jgi:hypothetical protein
MRALGERRGAVGTIAEPTRAVVMYKLCVIDVRRKATIPLRALVRDS